MITDWKFVPMVATEEMNKSGMRWLAGIQHMRTTDKCNALNEAFSAMLAAAPVPPAGGEVETFQDWWKSLANPWLKDSAKVSAYQAWQHQSAHVTRLQADKERLEIMVNNGLQANFDIRKERDALKAEIAHIRQHKNDYMEAAEETRKALQSELTTERTRADVAVADCNDAERELTKARELLNNIEILAMDDGATVYSDAPGFIRDIRDLLTHQSAPVAKPCSHVWVSAENRGAGAGEICQACSVARPAAKDGE